MQLETYISDLLYRYECVTIPEFGAFLTQRVSASIDDATNTFYAPSKSVSFNEQIQTNDGLLARYIADVEKIPFEAANNKIAKRVKILKSSLTQGETLIFKNIGEIVLNTESKILFEPTYNLNYLTDSFGLTQFVSPSVNREVYKKQVEEIEKATPIVITTEKRKTKPYFRYAAVALIALTIGGFAASKFYVNKIETHNQLAEQEAYEKLDSQIQQATFNLNPFPTITLNVSKQTGNYHIVAGAFRVEKNCYKKIQQLREEGFKARKLGVNKYGLHEVVYGSYEGRIEALQALRKIKKSHNKDAWLKRQVLDNTTTGTTHYIPKKASEKTAKLVGPPPSLTTDLSEKSVKEKGHFVFNNNPSLTPIIKEVDNLRPGFYTVIGVFSNVLKRDEYMLKLSKAGQKNVGFFFDKKSQNYLIFNERFNDLDSAKAVLTSKKNAQFKGKIGVVKVEN